MQERFICGCNRFAGMDQKKPTASIKIESKLVSLFYCGYKTSPQISLVLYVVSDT